MAVFTRGKVTKQPNNIIGLDRSNPIVKSPLVCEVGGVPINLVTGKWGVKNVPASEGQAVTPQGRVATFNGDTKAAHLYSGHGSKTFTQFTAAGVFTWKNSGSQTYPELCGLSSGNNSFRMGPVATQYGGDIGLTKGGVVVLNGLSLPGNVPVAFFCSHDQASGEYYLLLKNLNTGAITSTTQTNTSASSASDGTYSVGNSRQDASESWNGSIALCYMGSAFVKQEYGYSFLANPWQILETKQRRLLIPAATVGVQALTPALFTNSPTFYAATVTPGAKALTPALFTNSPTYYAATVTPGTKALTPALFTNNASFYSPTVTKGAATLAPALVTNTSSFYSPSVAPGVRNLTAALFTDGDTFYVPSVGQGGITLAPGLVSNSSTFYTPSLAVGTATLTPSRWDNSSTFYIPTVGTGGLALLPQRLDNSSTFYTPAIVGGSISLLPQLAVNTSQFFAPQLDQELPIDFWTNDQSWFDPNVYQGLQLEVALLVNPNSYPQANLTQTGGVLSPTLYRNATQFYAATLMGGTPSSLPGATGGSSSRSRTSRPGQAQTSTRSWR